MIPRLSQFSPRFAETIAYMLQSVEYEAGAYVRWLWRVKNFRSVMHRRSLDRTSIARLFVWFLRIGIAAQWLCAVIIGAYAIYSGQPWVLVSAVALFVLAPQLWAYLVLVPLIVARTYVIVPRRERYRRATKDIFAGHTGTIVAVAGSYGKTTMKEILLTVLTEGKKVVATPANKNTAAAHYAFAKSLVGDEDVVIVEFGEGKPGDVASFTETINPDIGIIAGLAPAHLDQYGSFAEASEDIFSLATYLGSKPVYVNTESVGVGNFMRDSFIGYSRNGAGSWHVDESSVSLAGLSFLLKNETEELRLHSRLLGKHLLGALSAAAVIALDMGLTVEQVAAGIAKTVPYEHRMQPYPLAGGWVIDDAYNGNIMGVAAGTELLAELDARRKIYVTPGLVDQGADTERIHVQMGKLIAGAAPNITVLMKNSVTAHIRRGLLEAGYAGEIRIEHHPLEFYKGLDQYLAADDICMLQNDWTDNYA